MTVQEILTICGKLAFFILFDEANNENMPHF